LQQKPGDSVTKRMEGRTLFQKRCLRRKLTGGALAEIREGKKKGNDGKKRDLKGKSRSICSAPHVALADGKGRGKGKATAAYLLWKGEP